MYRTKLCRQCQMTFETLTPALHNICEDCEQNAAEAAYEQLCADFHDGGSTRFVTLQEQQIAARRLK